ncbi:MAG: ribbon-helix-helix protein, CopG family [Gaiellaceae bacterium]
MTRTQIYLGDDERDLLERTSKATGASVSELIRRAIRSTYRLELTKEEKLDALRRSAGLWADRDFTGAEYVDAIRGGDMNEGLRRLGIE